MADIFLKIVNLSVSASFIVLAVLLLRLMLKRSPKWITLLLWGVVAVRLICPFTIESATSLIPSKETINSQIMEEKPTEIKSNVPLVDAETNSVNDEVSRPVIDAEVANPNDNVINSTENEVVNSNSDEVTSSVNGDNAENLVDPNTVTYITVEDKTPLQVWIPILAIVWLIGIAVLLVYTAVSYVYLKFSLETAVRYKNNIFQSEMVASPFVLGVINPKIYLPFKINESDMEHVIAHEQAHIKRKDHLWKLFGFLILAVYWFNPLIWVAYVMMCKDIELACDEKVIKNLDNENKANYSQALLNCSVKRKSVSACPIAFGEGGVKGRIKRILSYKKPPLWIMIISVVLIIVLCLTLLTDPISEKKTDQKQDKVETVVSKDDDTKDTTTEPSIPEKNEPSESKPEESNPTESKPEDSKPQDTSSEQKPVTSKPQDTTSKPQETPKQEFSEDEIGRLSDNTEKLSKNTIQKIKIDYLKSRAIDDYTQNDIDEIFLEYYATLSDGSMFLYINSKIPTEGKEITLFVEVYQYAYTCDANKIPLIYKNERFEELWCAHRAGLISKDIIDEVLQKFPQIDVSDKYSFREYYPDNLDRFGLPELSPEEKQQILKERGTSGKELGLEFEYDYVEHCSKYYEETTVRGVNIMSYYGTYNGAAVIQMDGPGKSSYGGIKRYTIANVTFDWADWEGIIVYKNKSFYSLEEAYEKGLLTVEDLKKVQNVHRIIW